MKQLNMTVSELWDDTYIVPLYQRNYAWRENEISRLLKDIYDSYTQSESRNYYIGSLVVIQRTDGSYEVIDGQQRLTTLQIICKELHITNSSRLKYDSRPEVERFFSILFNNGEFDFSETALEKDEKTYRLCDAIRIIRDTKLEDDLTFSGLSESQKLALARYIANKVIIVRTVLPSDTDVAAYFEIMNNRGEQLQEHEIVKARLMNGHYSGQKLPDSLSNVFSKVWVACSQMNIPIQHGLREYRQDSGYPLFGDDYESLRLDCLRAYCEGGKHDMVGDGLTIDEILSSDYSLNSSLGVDLDEPVDQYKSIIDFPNFLLVVLKSISPENIGDRVRLNSNFLLEEFDKVKPDAMEFLCKLLKYRVLFDRYVIHNRAIDDNEDGDGDTKWEMQRPKKDGNSIVFVNSFPMGDDKSDRRDYSRIVKQQSMLQVSFKSSNRTWLFDLLKWLDLESKDDIMSIKSSGLIIRLDEWIRDYFEGLLTKNGDGMAFPFEESGTSTPHFVFNYIDYLYWVAAQKKEFDQMFSHLAEVRNNDFDFHYYNSVEHHWAQSNGGDEIRMDALGNLCLISRRNNSSLNDKAPTAKANAASDMRLQPKRRIMYAITNAERMWEKEQIEAHHAEIITLLKNRMEILR